MPHVDAPGMRLNFDPLVATQRPFVFYAAVVIVNWASNTVLHFLLGFSLRPTHCKSGVAMYHRRAERAANPSNASVEAIDQSIILSIQQMFDNSSMESAAELPYRRPQFILSEERTAYPIVFIHGLGIGFAHYIFLISRYAC